MSINGLQTAVLEAGGHIEDRMLVDEFPNFTPVYTFTREALEKMLENERLRCAQTCKNDRSQAYEWTGDSRPGGYFAKQIIAMSNP